MQTSFFPLAFKQDNKIFCTLNGFGKLIGENFQKVQLDRVPWALSTCLFSIPSILQLHFSLLSLG